MRKKNCHTLIVFLLFFLGTGKEAKCSHIVGGELSYNCIGEGVNLNTNLFQIEYSLYTSCDDSEEDSISILVNKWENGEKETIFLRLDTILIVDNFDYLCLDVDSDFCYRKHVYIGQYEFEKNNDNTFIETQICCRSSTIENLDFSDPDQIGVLGAAHIIEITSQAKAACNSSPRFEVSIPPFFCKDEYFELLLSETDTDGDQLVFEFCAPFNFDFTSTIANLPFLPFALPEYSAQNPLGQSVLNLDSNTGILSGTPSKEGSYVVGLCITEYRNGIYLSTVRRDIVLNIVNCVEHVLAKIEADFIDNQGVFVINSCDNTTVNFSNESLQEEYISSLIWSFENDTTVFNSTAWNPTILFENAGTYFGTLILNPEEECSDTARIQVNIAEDIIPEFEAIYDTCISGPVQFINNSLATSNLVSWEWVTGDNLFSNDFSPVHSFESPGNYEIELKAIDQNGCRDSISHLVNWQPAPAVILISPDVQTGCVPLSTKFNNLSWPIDSTYSITWDFGNGAFLTDVVNPIFDYNEVGEFDVYVSVESPLGCQVDTIFESLITVRKGPEALFEYTPNVVTNFDPTIALVNQSKRAVAWQWNFNNELTTFIQEPSYTFSDTGFHNISLIAFDQYNCKDTLTKVVEIKQEIKYFVPNAFSPNGDGINDVFNSVGYFESMQDFKIEIFNRWGERIFSSVNPSINWTGYSLTKNQPLPTGLYLYTIQFKNSERKTQSIKGFVTLVK